MTTGRINQVASLLRPPNPQASHECESHTRTRTATVPSRVGALNLDKGVSPSTPIVRAYE
eukprot:1308181-Pyramimonas_sp.AAC.1